VLRFHDQFEVITCQVKKDIISYWTKISAVQVQSSGRMNDQQTQTTYPSGVVIREQLKNASRNIKNRWSGGVTQVSGTSNQTLNDLVPEEQGLLTDAAEPAFDSPAHYHHPLQIHGTSHNSNTFSDRNILVDTSSTSSSFIPSTSQLQRAINQSLLNRGESNKLSEMVLPVQIDKRETMC